MNTPAHIAASLLVWRDRPGWSSAAAVTAGAILPDAPMFGFYAYHKWIGVSEREMWSHLYFEEQWQFLFDIFNSIPLLLLAGAACHAVGFSGGVLFSLSAVLHMLCDLPLHNDDAHRHFLPLTDFRFESPVSYWDPHHYGFLAAPLELLFAIGACAYVSRKGSHTAMRKLSVATLCLYLFGIGFAIIVWSGLLR